MLDWYTSYLKECCQLLSVQGVLSDTRSFVVPLGLVLDLALFIMYTKWLGSTAQWDEDKYYLYADEIHLYVTVYPWE